MQPWQPEEFTEQLRRVGQQQYHDKHPFHRLMNEGQLTREQIQLWVANRFYYQLNIPIKDAAILSNCPIREVRRLWLHRIIDHDGTREGEGADVLRKPRRRGFDDLLANLSTPSAKKSVTPRMRGCCRLAWARASCRKRSPNSRSAATWGARTLIATRRPSTA